MERPRIAYIVAVAAVIAASAFVAGTASAKAAPTAKAAPARSYVVRSGDGGWSQLAKAHGTSMQHLLAANHATTATPVKTGQHVRLPADARDDHARGTAAHPTTAKH